MKVFVLANQKGGVGKSTTAAALAAILRQEQNNVLFIDADPQGNSTDTYKAQVTETATLYDVLLDDERIPLKDAVQGVEAGDIIASDPLLTKADSILLNDVEGIYRLQDAIKELHGYDYIVIDT